MALQHAQQRKEEAQRRLSNMTQSAKQNDNPRAMISQLQTEVRELQNRAKVNECWDFNYHCSH